MNSTEEIEDIELQAHPAAMGWAIVAICGGESFFVEGGLISPDTKLKYWQRNIGIIAKSIARKKTGL